MKFARWGLGVLAGLVLLLAAAWLAVPPLAKWQIEGQGSEKLGREVRVGKVDFEPWALRLTLNDLSVAAGAADSDRSPQLQFARLRIDADMRSLLRRAPVVESLELEGLHLRLARLGERRFDIDDLLDRLPKPDPAAPQTEAPRFALFNLQVRDAQVALEDRPLQRVHEISDLHLALPFLSNLPDDLAVKVLPLLALKVNGSALELRGESVPFSAERATQLQLKLSALDLSRWWAYLPAALPLQPVGGLLDTDLVLLFSQPANGEPQVGLNGTARVRDLTVQDTAAAPLLGWKSAQIMLADVRPLQRRVALKSLQLDGVVVDVNRDAQGGLNLLRLLQPMAAGAPVVVPAGVPDGPRPSTVAPAAASAPAGAPAGAPTVASADAAKAAGWTLSIDELEVSGARLRWRDATTQPAAALDLAEVSLKSRGLRWPVQAPVPLEAALTLREGEREVGRVTAQGEASDTAARLAVEATGIDLAAAAPYLRQYLRPSLEGRVGASARLDWASGSTPRLALKAARLQAEGLRLSEPESGRGPGRSSKREAPLQVAAVELADANLDLLAQRVQIGTLRLRQPALQLQRDGDGVWNASRWPALPADPGGQSAPAPVESAQWRLELGELQVEGGSLRFADATPRPGAGVPPVALQIRALQLAAQGIAWPLGTQAVKSRLSLQLVPPPGEAGSAVPPVGRIDWRGELWPQPAGARGTVAIERFPLHLFEPYIGDRAPVSLRSAELGYRGEIDARLGAQGLTVAGSGELLLADLHVSARGEDSAELLAWQALRLEPLKFALAPGGRPQVEIGQALLTDFFAKLEITEQGRLNLQDVALAPSAAAPVPPAAAGSAAPTTAAGTAPASGSRFPIDISIGGTKFVNGRVDFSDRFIRPNYRADLSELNGSIGRISSATPQDLATIDIRGRAAGTALLEIGGAANPTASPLALDITARMIDLELAPLSPYAGKYAGYGIERGKLSVDLAYKIDPDGKLQASNKVILNQLTFGDKVDSPSATKLPVRLAVALLTDSNGVIDINLPISGSVSDPQFSVWGLVAQVIGNLLTKAVTAPFAMLTGSEGADLSCVPFAPGSTTLAGDAAATLDKVAKALANRPALRMTVTGAADPSSEREAMQRADLEARLQAQRRRDLLSAGVTLAAPAMAPQPGQAASAPAMSPPPGLAVSAPLSAEEREKLVRQVYRATKLPDKPRNAIGLVKDIPPPEMEALLVAAVPVTEDSARQLALQRGLAVRDALIARGLPGERLFLAAPKLRAAGETDWTTCVPLVLAAK